LGRQEIVTDSSLWVTKVEGGGVGVVTVLVYPAPTDPTVTKIVFRALVQITLCSICQGEMEAFTSGRHTSVPGAGIVILTDLFGPPPAHTLLAEVIKGASVTIITGLVIKCLKNTFATIGAIACVESAGIPIVTFFGLTLTVAHLTLIVFSTGVLIITLVMVIFIDAGTRDRVTRVLRARIPVVALGSGTLDTHTQLTGISRAALVVGLAGFGVERVCAAVVNTFFSRAHIFIITV